MVLMKRFGLVLVNGILWCYSQPVMAENFLKKLGHSIDKRIDKLEDGQRRQYAKEIQQRARQGDAGSQFELARMYADGDTIPRNDQQALYWFRLAYAQAQANARNGQINHANCQDLKTDDNQLGQP